MPPDEILANDKYSAYVLTLVLVVPKSVTFPLVDRI